MGGANKMTPQDAYRRVLDNGWSQELEDIVVNSGDPEWAYCFALNAKGASIPRLEQIIIDSESRGYAYAFACDVPKANIQRLEQVVIDSGDPEWAYIFARDVNGANISDLIDFVLINEPKWIKELFEEYPELRHKYELGE